METQLLYVMHRLQKMLVVLLLLGCVVGVASAATYDVKLPASGNFQIELNYSEIQGTTPAELVATITAPATTDVVLNASSNAVISGAATGSESSISDGTHTGKKTGDGTLPFGSQITIAQGQTKQITAKITPDGTGASKVVLTLDGYVGTAGEASSETLEIPVTPVLSTAQAKIGIEVKNVDATGTPTNVITQDPAIPTKDNPQPAPYIPPVVVDNGGADNGLELLAAAKATPTANVTATPTVEVTVAPTTTVTGNATAVPTDVPSTPTASVTGGQGTSQPTATQAPAPILGILAGLGAAALILRRN